MILSAVQLALVLSLVVKAAARFPGSILKRAQDIQEEYDFVIVGGGTSGLVVGNRLSELSNYTVLVIDAGPILDGQFEFDNLLIPGMSNGPSAVPHHTWQSLPNKEAGNRRTSVLVPKIVGGGSAINGMSFQRGSRGDADVWKQYTGDEGWGWESLLKYFKKLESYRPPAKELAEEFGLEWDEDAHGYDGPLGMSIAPFIWPSVKYITAAEKGIGIPTPGDGGNGQVGALWVANPLNERNERSYSKNAYHDVAKSRENYQLLVNNTVTKVLFEEGTATASGVEFAASANAERHTVRARKEVILAAGSIHTAKILQLSGVGDRRLLEKLGINVRVDSPGVGQNFQDHGASRVGFSMTFPGPSASDLYTNQTYRREMMDLYLTNHTGPFTVSTGSRISFLAFPMFSTRYQEFIDQARSANASVYLRPDAHPSIVAGYKSQVSLLLSAFGTNTTAVLEQVSTLSSVQKPLSRGYVEINSVNPFANPDVDYRTLSNPFDIWVIVEGLRYVRRLMARPELEVARPRETSPGPTVDGDEELADYVRSTVSASFFHPVGTAHMGKRENGAVVDTKLRVYGAKKLRVVDAGVFPTIPAAHICNVVYAVAERAADLIKEDA